MARYMVNAAFDYVIPYLNPIAARLVCATLTKLQHGCLRLVFRDGSVAIFGEGEGASLSTEIRVKSDNFFWRILKDADIGVSDSYIAGEWECSDLVAFFKIMIANRDAKAIGDEDVRYSILGRLANKYQHYRRQNSLKQSRKNISDHYDLSNDLFRLFLDESMTYSSALFRNDAETLEQGQRNKLLHIIRKARICSTDHVLEIGCGWGSFAILAAQTTGCKMTCVTLSTEQMKEVEERARALNLKDKITVRLVDYRLLEGTFDKIVSIEMLEAVGFEYYDAYFGAIDRLLKPGGIAVIQVITTPDQRFEWYRKGVDFIQKHIFPGSLCPSLLCLMQSMTRSSNLILHHVENIGFHYARTLAEWRRRFLKHEDDVRALGFNEDFIRKWVYYFGYCEAGFATRTLGDLHLVLTRPNNADIPAYEHDVWTLPPTETIVAKEV